MCTAINKGLCNQMHVCEYKQVVITEHLTVKMSRNHESVNLASDMHAVLVVVGVLVR